MASEALCWRRVSDWLMSGEVSMSVVSLCSGTVGVDRQMWSR